MNLDALILLDTQAFLQQYSWLLYVALFGAIIYFMMIRPNKKRLDEQRRVVEALTPGVRVMLSAGIIGTVRAVGDAQLVVELAPGVEVTALKQVVIKVLGPDDEEFEYSDSDSESDSELEPPAGMIEGTPSES
ncbi:MAG: preprotein translocase subunit YajC [Propionibacteriaceae bacterium]|jgi:preprotein translocase subunit YajC|nr:preprotein translocase subunit YajC [Propionibacteriaceae bacterium]